MPSEAKLGLAVGVGLVLAAALIFHRPDDSRSDGFGSRTAIGNVSPPVRMAGDGPIPLTPMPAPEE